MKEPSKGILSTEQDQGSEQVNLDSVFTMASLTQLEAVVKIPVLTELKANNNAFQAVIRVKQPNISWAINKWLTTSVRSRIKPTWKNLLLVLRVIHLDSIADQIVEYFKTHYLSSLQEKEEVYVEKMGAECLSLCDNLKDGNYDENIRHLKYKLASLSKLATEQLNEKSSTNDMLLGDLKEMSQVTDELREDLKRLRSLQVQPEPVKDTTEVKKEPSSPSHYYQQLEHQAAATSQCQVKEEPEDDDVLPSDHHIPAAGLPGVEVCAETTLVVTNSPQSFIWEGYGLKVHIPQGCLPEGVDKCTIKIQASLSGQYEFPENSFLVSGVFWLRCEPQCKFSVPISMEIQHCARAENTSKLSFVKAYCSQMSLPYTFRAVAGGRFSSSSSYGILELHSFSGVAISQEGSEEREYMARLFYLNQTVAVNEIHVHMVVTWNDEAHITFAKKEYLQEKLALPGSDLLVDFESEEIELDVPVEGITLHEGWTVTPLIPPVISKKHVDSYQPHKRIPHCELSAQFKCGTAEAGASLLCYQVKLLGAKKPYNMFMIKPPSFTAKRSLSLDDVSGPSPKKPRTAGTESVPTLKELQKELRSKAAEWEDIGIQLNIDDGQLEELRKNNPGDSKACFRGMLRLWLKRVDPAPSWSAIAEAIDVIGDEQLAEHLRSTYVL